MQNNLRSFYAKILYRYILLYTFCISQLGTLPIYNTFSYIEALALSVHISASSVYMQIYIHLYVVCTQLFVDTRMAVSAEICMLNTRDMRNLRNYFIIVVNQKCIIIMSNAVSYLSYIWIYLCINKYSLVAGG